MPLEPIISVTGDEQRAAVGIAGKPSFVQGHFHDLSREGPRDMMPPLGPVQTEPHCRFPSPNSGQVQIKIIEERLKMRARSGMLNPYKQHVQRDKPFGHQDTKPARDMIVTAARHASAIAPGGACEMIHRRQGREPFKHAGDLCIGNSVIHMTPALQRRRQTGTAQLLEVRARGLRADIGSTGQLFVGEGAPVHQGAQDTRPAGVRQGRANDVQSGFRCHVTEGSSKTEPNPARRVRQST